jgi:hypothetical protein
MQPAAIKEVNHIQGDDTREGYGIFKAEFALFPAAQSFHEGAIDR